MWSPSPEEAQAVKIVLSGGFGGFIRAFIRHSGTVIRAAGFIFIGSGSAYAFAPAITHAIKQIDWLARYVDEPIIPVSVIVGLTGIALFEKLLKAAENADFGLWFKRGRE